MRFLLLVLLSLSLASADCSGQMSRYVPAVIGDGGGVVNVTISLADGPGRAFVSVQPRTGTLTQESIGQAADLASRLSGKKCDVMVDFGLDGHTSYIDGPSAGTAIAVMTYALLEGEDVRSDAIITGAVDGEGNVLPVGGLYEKARGAVGKGAAYFVTPAESFYEMLLLRDMERAYGLKIVQARTVDEVIGFMIRNETIEQHPLSVEERKAPEVPDYDFPDPQGFTLIADRMIEAEKSLVSTLPGEENDTAEVKSFYGNEVERQLAIRDKGYLFSAANEAFLDYVDIATIKVILSGDPDIPRKKGDASICLANLDMPQMTDKNFQYLVGADLRRSWAEGRLESVDISDEMLIEEEYVAYNELMYSEAWCLVAQGILSASPEGGSAIDEKSWEGLAREMLSVAEEAGDGDTDLKEKLDSARLSFSKGRYGAAVFDSVYVIEYSKEAPEDLEGIDVGALVGENRSSLWGRVYQSHAAFVSAQNGTKAAYETARYAKALDDATERMIEAANAPTDEEPEDAPPEDSGASMLILAVAGVSIFLFVLLLIYMRRRNDGDHSARTGKAFGAEQEKGGARVPQVGARRPPRWRSGEDLRKRG
ncbi:MAG: S16 family serine protease [Candidatus Micrarchaeota archaeon]